jgi:acyl-CoA ligase (AMP-forming) (exosortase A-associated)
VSALTTTFFQLLSDNLAVRAQKTALVDGDRSATYAEVASEVDRIAGYLQAQGVRPGDRVIVHLRKRIAEVTTMLAVSKIGAVIVNVNVQWTLEQLGYVADDCGARLVIVEPRAAKALAETELSRSVSRVLAAGEAPGDDRFDGWAVAMGSPVGSEISRLDTELAMIIYTSGSTGKPKGVMLSHRNIVAGARSVARYLRLGDDERLLSVLPYSFDYGLNQLTTMLLMGGTVVHQPVFMATEIVNALEKHSITGLAAVPPLWSQIVRLLNQAPRSFPALRRVTNSGGKVPLNILEGMPKVFPGAEVVLMYGLTEAFRSTYLDPQKFAVKMGSIGRAIPGAEVYVIKHGEGVAGPGEQGELVHRGPLVSLGYWGKPEITAEKIRPCPELFSLIGNEPVVYSGDIVRVDADGDLWFVARNDAMIKTSGFRLSPDEVEDLIHRSGLVGDAVAFGVADDDLGEVVHVAVTALDGFDQSELLEHCRMVMPHYMIPRQVHLWDGSMPRTSSGKLARPDIVAQCRESLSRQSEHSRGDGAVDRHLAGRILGEHSP